MFVSYAQNFEDVLLWRALHDVGCGFYIDVGAHHPIVDSVSKAFYEHGWRGIHVEPSLAYADLLRIDRPEDQVVQAAVSDEAKILRFYEIPETGLSSLHSDIVSGHRERGFRVCETTTPCVTLDDVFGLCVGRDVHWLKVDVEGHERNVLLGWRTSPVRPWVVVLESTLPLTTQESYEDWEPLLLEKGYGFVWFDGLNRFYIHESHKNLAERFNAPPNVFDGFALNGTASAPFGLLLKKEIEHQIKVRADERVDIVRDHERAQEKIRAEIALKETQLRDLAEAHLAERGAASELHASAVRDLRAVLESLRDEYTALTSQQQTEKSTILDLLVQEQASRAASEALRGQLEADLVRQLQQTSEYIAAREAQFAEQQAEERKNATAIADRHGQVEFQLSRELEGAKSELASLHREQTLRGQLFADEVTEIRRELEAQMREAAGRESQLSSQLAKVSAENLARAQIQEEQLRSRQRRLFELESSAAASERDIREARAEIHALMLERVHREREISSSLEEMNRERIAIAQSYELKVRDLKTSFDQQTQEHALQLEAQERRLRELESGVTTLEQDARTQIDHAKHLVAELGDARDFLVRSTEGQGELVDSAFDYQTLLNACSNQEQHLSLALRLVKHNRVIADHSLQLLKSELDELHRSFSWRITKPIRMLGGRGRSRKSRSPISCGSVPECGASKSLAESYVHVTSSVPANTADVTVSNELRMSSDQLQSSAILRGGIYHVDDLIRLDDVEFIEHAYLAVLNRIPDVDGLRYYLGRLRLGYSKLGILDQLKRSAEARIANTTVQGLERTKFVRWSRIPLVGRFIALFNTDADNESRRRIRRIESAVHALDQRVMRRFNDIDGQLATVIGRLHELVANPCGVMAPNSQALVDAAPRGPSAEEIEARRLAPEVRRTLAQLIHIPEADQCES
jgi:FkbM family methyltransferase